MPKYRTTIEFEAESGAEAWDYLDELEEILEGEDASPMWDLRRPVPFDPTAGEETESSGIVWFVSDEDGKAHCLETPDELTEDDTPYADEEALCGVSGPWEKRVPDADLCEECAG